MMCYNGPGPKILTHYQEYNLLSRHNWHTLTNTIKHGPQGPQGPQKLSSLIPLKIQSPPQKKTRLCAKKYLPYQIQGSKIVKKSKSIHKQRRYGRKATRLLVSESVSYIKLKTSLASKNCYQNTKAIQNIAVILYFLILVIESLSRLTNLRIININRGIPYTANGTQITHPTIFIFVLFLFLV